MLGKFLRADVAHAVLLFALFEDINHVAAAGFVLAVGVAADRFGLFLRFVGNLFGQAEVEGVHRAGLDAEGLLVLADAVAAHGALAGFAGNFILRDHFPWAGMDAVFATDAYVLVDHNRAFFVFGDRFDGADGGAGGEAAMHTTVARPQRRHAFEHGRFHGDPIGRR